MATWSALIALLSIHLATNYSAVRAVSMRCLNRQRANIVFGNIMQHGNVLNPSEVSKRERVFEHDGILRWVDDTKLGHCKIGVTLEVLLSRVGRQDTRTGSLKMKGVNLADLTDVFVDQAYILWYADSEKQAFVALKQHCTPRDQLQAWAHALLLAHTKETGTSERKPDDHGVFQASLAEIRQTLSQISKIFDKHIDLLRLKGWDLDVAPLETQAGSRVQIDNRPEK